jgi:hypothetical protein
LVFRFVLRVFDRSLKSEVAGQGKEQVIRAAEKIRNPFVRRMVLRHLVDTGGALAVSLVRSGFQSRMQTGLWIALAGVAALVAAFSVDSWFPLSWR